MPVYSRLLIILLVGVCTSVQAMERRYLATIDDSQWKMTRYSNLQCRMEHQIPRFGVAAFTQEAGRGLRLELLTRHKFKRGINVELRSETSGWNTRKTRMVLSRFETSGKKNLFSISSRTAEQVFQELHNGYQPGFLFYEDNPLIASLSNVRFGNIEESFAQCIDELNDVNFDDVRVSAIHFEPDEEFASIKQEQTAFNPMLDYLQIDDNISEIVVTGHADHTGLACYNEGLSERRAWYVYDLLIALGIDSSLLRVDYLGEQKPVKKGSAKGSLAANRRVTVELRR